MFIDLHGIDGGERWRETLRKANATCEAVILQAWPDSVASVECQKELELAEALGKANIKAILRELTKDDPRLAQYAERQFIDLSAAPPERMEPFEHDGKMHRVEFSLAALNAIKTRLDDLGVAPGSFAWPPKDKPIAEPYPGLSALGKEDAGIFFSREADMMTFLREVRRLRERGSPRTMVIQAASGAGKSSFLRARLWPKLGRTCEFVPLATVRPAKGIVTAPSWASGIALPGRRSRHRLAPHELHQYLHRRGR
ncbi:MAG: TIR domain-containing protein [Hyphomicrobiaceae bacterium]